MSQSTVRDERLDTILKLLRKDRLEAVYEIPSIRQLLERLEVLQVTAEQSPDEKLPQRLAEVERQLASLRAEQGEPGDLNAESPKLPVLLVKPTAEQKARLDLLDRKCMAEKASEVKEKDEPLIIAQLKEAARTQVMLDGTAQDPATVGVKLKELFVEHLLVMEGRTEANCERVDDLDPEMEYSEEEEEELKFSDALEGAELAEALLNQEANRERIRSRKQKALIRTRKEEMKQRRLELLRQPVDATIGQIATVECLQRALVKSRQETMDYWLLACVRDPAQAVKTVIRGQTVTKGWKPYFSKAEEVKELRESEDLRDFYDWLVEQKNRLDVLSQGDLYALAAYEPFRDTLQPLLRLREGIDPLALLLGEGGE